MKLSDFDHFRDHSNVRFKTETVHGKDVVIVSHMFSDTALWKEPLATETRGHVFDAETGELLSINLPKFFNVGERSTHLHDMVRSGACGEISAVYDKIDGSLITPLVRNGKVFLKSKKSFFSDVAVLAQSKICKGLVDLCVACEELDSTPIFEFTSPDNRVVIDYGEHYTFRLLAIRRKSDGQFWQDVLVKGMGEMFKIATAAQYKFDYDHLMHMVENEKGIEGWVIKLEDGTRLKLKTKWYLELHHAMTELTLKDVITASVNGTVDDLKAWMSSFPEIDLTEVEKIEHEIVEGMVALRNLVSDLVNECADQKMTVKDVALKYKGHELFNLIIQAYRGKENIGLEKFYLNYALEEWGKVRNLNQVLFNTAFSK